MNIKRNNLNKIFYLICFFFAITAYAKTPAFYAPVVTPLAFSEVSDGLPKQDIDVSHISNPIPRIENASITGNPPFYEVMGKRYTIMQSSQGYIKEGIASWYGTKFHGKRTSSGEVYDMFAMTAANKTLPIPCYVKVTSLSNGKEITVRINDRGPFHDNRIIDLSYTAAKKLGIIDNGTSRVRVEAVPPYQTLSIFSNEQEYIMKKKPMYLQTGAFKEKKSAERFASQTQQIVQLFPVSVEDNAYHFTSIFRVKIGPLENEQEVDLINNLLINAGLGKGMLVT